jgi:hypothetical protein
MKTGDSGEKRRRSWAELRKKEKKKKVEGMSVVPRGRARSSGQRRGV